MTAAFVYAAARTPFGRFNGALAGVRPDDLAATALRGALAKVPALDPAAIGDVVWGNANGAGEDNRNVGRMAVLLAGLPVSVPATTVNRLCGSSLDAAMMASRTIETGDADVMVAGGVESMTRAPWVLPKPSRAFPAGDVTAVSTTLGWRLVNPRMPKEWTVSLGEANERLQERYAHLPRAAGRLRGPLARAGRCRLERGVLRRPGGAGRGRGPGARRGDQTRLHPGDARRPQAGLPARRHHHSRQRLAAQRRRFGGRARLGAAAASRIGVDPIARVAGRAASALEPHLFGYAPVAAADQALRRAGIGWDDVGAVELNEAFAVQSLVCVDAWKIDPEIVNTKGGAIALGHPLGASGGRVLGTLAHVLAERGERWGVAQRARDLATIEKRVGTDPGETALLMYVEP